MSYYRVPRDLHSFPTRRSSDLPRDGTALSCATATPAREHLHLLGRAWLLQRCAHPASNLSARLLRFATRRSEEHTSELQSQSNLVCRLLLEKKKQKSKVHL